MGTRLFGPKEIDGLLVPLGKASTLRLLVNRSGLSLPRKSCSSQTIHTYKPNWLSCAVIFEALFRCHHVIIVGTSPDMTIAVDWNARPQLKQTNRIKGGKTKQRSENGTIRKKIPLQKPRWGESSTNT